LNSKTIQLGREAWGLLVRCFSFFRSKSPA
jgi:hypothetical protein